MVVKFLPSQLGINIHLAGIRNFGLNEEKTVKQLLSLPYQHVRIPIPLSEIGAEKGKWDFAKRDALIEQALNHKKIIHLQTGAKTIGWPEVWLPTWLTEKHPYLSKPHKAIDHHSEVQEFILEAIEQVAKHYLTLSQVQSMQLENEAFCKRLSVSNYRYINFAFHKKELAVLHKNNPKNVLVLQNLPLNHPLDLAESLSYVIKNSDIVGLNIYNQHIPYTFFQKMNDVYLSSITRVVKPLTALSQKQVYVTEIQTAAWLTGNNAPIKQFSEKIFEKTLKQYITLGAEIIFLWDIEQLIWQKDTTRLAALASLV